MSEAVSGHPALPREPSVTRGQDAQTRGTPAPLGALGAQPRSSQACMLAHIRGHLNHHPTQVGPASKTRNGRGDIAPPTAHSYTQHTTSNTAVGRAT